MNSVRFKLAVVDSRLGRLALDAASSGSIPLSSVPLKISQFVLEGVIVGEVRDTAKWCLEQKILRGVFLQHDGYAYTPQSATPHGLSRLLIDPFQFCGCGVVLNESYRAGLARMTPKTGPNSTLAGAAIGFRNEGQFIACLHASKNLGIPFDQLKAKMMSGDPPMKLGQAIHALKPNDGKGR